MLWLILLVAAALFAYETHRRYQVNAIRRAGRKLKSAPGCLPIVANAINFLRPRHDLLEWFVGCQRAFGFEPFTISIPSLPPVVVVNDPQNLEFVLKNDDTITKGAYIRRRSWDLFGYGIINSDGELWKVQRKAGLKFFAGAQLDVLIDQVLPETYFSKTRKILIQYAISGLPLDLQEVLLDMTTTVVGRMAYDMDIDASSPFSQAFDYASGQTERRFQNPLYPLTEFLTGSKLRASLREVKKFGQQIVSNAQTRRKAQEGEYKYQPVLGSLVDSLLDAFANDPVLTADAALNFLSAGRDTTAQSLTWTFYALMRHPSEVVALRREIDTLKWQGPFAGTLLGDDGPPNKSSNSDLKLTISTLQPSTIPITTSIFNESLRLYPPVPFEIKQCQAPTVLPDGTSLPTGTIILWCIWAINRAQELWGPDSDVFRSDRWLDKGGGETDDNSNHGDRRAKVVSKSAFEFPVFNGGPRSCLGKKMAEVMASWVLVQVWREFEFEEVIDDDDGGNPEEKSASGKQSGAKERRSQNSLTLPMQGGLPCRVRFREIEELH